jgi:hypothetical protein
MCSPAARCGWDSVTFPLKTRWGPVKWCFPNLFMSEKHLSCAHRVLRFWTFSQECCYIFYRLDTEGANGYHYIFIAYNPDWAHVRDKVSGSIERRACDVALHCFLSYVSKCSCGHRTHFTSCPSAQHAALEQMVYASTRATLKTLFGQE